MLAACILAGCLSRKDTTRFYVLTAPPPPAKTAESGRPFMVGVRITSADYLRTREMIVEAGPNQLLLSEANRWEEMPQAGFSRVLSARLAQDVPDCDLAPLPLATTNTPEFSVEIDLRSLQGRLSLKGEAEVSAELRILDARGRLAERDELSKTSPWNTASALGVRYSSLAAAESQAAADLADDIARKIKAYHRKVTGP